MFQAKVQRDDESAGHAFAAGIPARGYIILYHENEVNHCPGCGRTHWYVGRVSAECGFCGTALPLAESATGGGTRYRSHGPSDLEKDAA